MHCGRVAHPVFTELDPAVSAAVSVRRVALRISPGHEFNGIEETAPRTTYDALLRALAPDQDTFYGGDGHGYTDYPTLDEVVAAR